MILLRKLFSKFIELGFALAILILLLVFFLSHQRIQQLSDSAYRVNHTQLVRLELTEIMYHMTDVESAIRGFLLTRDSSLLKRRSERLADVADNLEELKNLTFENAAQQNILASLSTSIAQRQLLNEQILTLAAQGKADIQRYDLLKSREIMGHIEDAIQQMNEREMLILRSREATRDRLVFWSPLFLVLFFFIALLILSLSYLKIKSELVYSDRQLAINLEKTNEISELNQTLHHAEEIAHIGNWQRNLQTEARQFSDNLYRLLGVEPGAFSAHFENFFRFVHPEDQPILIAFNADLSHRQRSEPIEFRVIRADGQLRYWRATARVLCNEHGNEMAIGTAQDVTEEHLLKQELQQRAQFTETLLDNLVDSVAAYDQHLNILTLNQAGQSFFGKTRAEVIGKNIVDVFPQVLDNVEALKKLQDALQGERVYFSKYSTVGGDRVLDVYHIPLRDADQQVTGVLSIARDITDAYQLRRELEERSRFAEMLIDSSVDMIVAYDQDLRITSWNKTCEEKLGFSKAQVFGKHLLEVFPYFENTDRIKDLHRALQGEFIHTPVRKFLQADLHYEGFLIPLKDENGQISGVLSIAHDMTDMVNSAAQLSQLNASLEQKNQELARSNAELASFSYVASHDLQEPLRKIQSFAGLILTSENARLSDTGQDYFRRMRSAADRMQRLIEDLLAYSRTNTSADKFVLTDLNKLLQDAQQELSETIHQKQATIESVSLPTLEVIPFQFRQLLVNLLGNALKYQRPGTAPHIAIGCESLPAEQLDVPVAANKKYLKISIADNGIGFEPQYAERIFEVFQRLHGHSEYEGTGIGLAICKKIVQNHQGYLRAEGRPGQGATFLIYLPQ